MNITFFLGNGFDLQLGLKTRYSDFLQENTIVSPSDDENIKKFKVELSKEPNRTLWADAEKAMGMHLGKYNDSTINEYIECIQDFEEKIIQYLQKQQDMCDYAKKDDIRKGFIDFALNFPSDTLSNGALDFYFGNEYTTNNYNFVTLNYTNVIDNIIKCCVEGKEAEGTIGNQNINSTKSRIYFHKPIHVHGTLDTHIIMGVNDRSQLKTSPELTIDRIIKRVLLKPEICRSIRDPNAALAKQVIEDSDVILVYGVSFGMTDKLWWDEIILWLEKDEKHRLVAFMRGDVPIFDKRLPWDELMFEGEKQNEIAKKMNLTQSYPNYERLLNQIYVIMNTNRLKLEDFIQKDATTKTNKKTVVTV